MREAGLFLRWSWRDLRARWIQVAALALVIALGTGTYASLLSTSAWRRLSNDASFALVHVHAVEAALAPGSTTAQGSLARVISSLPDAAAVTGRRERLVVPTQVEAGNALVPGVIVGSGPPTGEAVDGVFLSAGAPLDSRGSAAGGLPTAVLDLGFARQHGLPQSGTLRVAGGQQVRYVGLGQSPEYFIATAGAAGAPFVSQATYAPLFTTLRSAQRLAGAPGRVNDAVLTLRPGTSAATVAAELRAALRALSPPVAATVTTRAELPAYHLLYADIGSDEELWRVIALLVLAGAAFAALNLTTRIVEAQRREIGIAMALGARPALCALRPLLFAAEVALIGVVLGVGVGEIVDLPLAHVFANLLPLPLWRTPFQPGVFAGAAAIGFVLPFAAATWPVLRAVSREPVEAIRVGHLAARRSGLAPMLRALHLPGPGYREIPLRNALRTPRRSLLTLAGVAAALATLVTIVGLLDTFQATLARATGELLREAPGRVSVTLRGDVPLDSSTVRTVRALPPVGRVAAGLAFTGELSSPRGTIAVTVEALGTKAPWRPALVAGSRQGGLVLSEKAAGDLGLVVGSHVVLQHPRAIGGGMETARTTLKVAGIEPSPLRALAFMDLGRAAALTNLVGRTNQLTVVPAPGRSDLDVQRALLEVPGVASAQSVRATLDAVSASLEQFRSILNVTSGVALLLVLLIAFNTAAIGTAERARENATMLAFGLPTRSVLAMSVVESLVVGGIGTGIGLLLGDGLLTWLTDTTVASVLPEIGVSAALSGASVLTVLLLGTGAVTLAPTFTLRRLRHLDVPSTLRVVE